MPKKTRQEKILAELHRLQEQQKKTEEVQVSSSEGKVSLNFANDEKKVDTPLKVETPSKNYSYVIKDLRKTVIFAVGTIVFEIILSLVLNHQTFIK